ncbi:MAG: hypothetical protein AMXMBFR80_18040 [Dehalococcoidia bacterium]
MLVYIEASPKVKSARTNRKRWEAVTRSADRVRGLALRRSGMAASLESSTRLVTVPTYARAPASVNCFDPVSLPPVAIHARAGTCRLLAHPEFVQPIVIDTEIVAEFV